MRTALPLLVVGLLVAACSTPLPAPPPEPTLTAEDLHGTVWFDVCSDTEYWIRLNENGTYDFNTQGASGPWENDGTDTWSLSGSVLTLSWSDGYRTASFDLSNGLTGRIDGESSSPCDGVVYLERQ